MSKEITLESIHTLLSGFIVKQEAFNSKVDVNFASLDAKVVSLDTKVNSLDAKVNSLDAKVNFVQEELAEFRREEKANHNLSHRMIMQSFEAISDIRSELDTDNTKPWLKK